MPNKRMLYLIPMLFLQVLCHHPSPATINLSSAIGNYNINHLDPVSLQSSHNDLFILFLQYTLIRCKRHIVFVFLHIIDVYSYFYSFYHYCLCCYCWHLLRPIVVVWTRIEYHQTPLLHCLLDVSIGQGYTLPNAIWKCCSMSCGCVAKDFQRPRRTCCK